MKFEWDFSEMSRELNRLAGSSFTEHAKQMAQDIARALLKILRLATPIEDGELIDGWSGNKLLVVENGDKYEVLIVNKTPYAPYVNDGHRSYNQYGGPYKIKNRVKVPTPYKWQKGDATWYVFGHFFVERSIVQLKESKKIEDIILRELHKWWEGA